MTTPRRAGISLIEVLIAATVLGVAVVPMIAMFTLGGQASAAGEHELQAALLAHEIVERTRAETERWLLGSNRSVPLARPQVDLPPGFTFHTSTEPIEPDLHRLTITIYWKDGKRDRNLKLSALVSLRPAVVESGAGASPYPFGLGAPSAAPARRPAGFTGWGQGS